MPEAALPTAVNDSIPATQPPSRQASVSASQPPPAPAETGSGSDAKKDTAASSHPSEAVTSTPATADAPAPGATGQTAQPATSAGATESSPRTDADETNAPAENTLPSDILASHVQEPPPAAGLRSGGELFSRLTARLSRPTCPEGEAVARWRKRYAGHPGSFARHLSEILPLLDFVSREVEASGLPAEFAFIPIVESWYRPEAIGPGGPAGMWQMIASTARNHGIHIQAGYDGRLSPVESTRAALSYLKTLHGMFDGDWQATVMAYNAGEYRLLKAFRQQGSREASGVARKPRGLSAITYDYVAKLQALSCLLAEPERSGLALPLQASFRPLAPVLVAKDADSLDRIAADYGVGARQLRELNPGYRQGRIVVGVPRLVLMPEASAQANVTPDAPAKAEAAPAATASADAPSSPDGLHEVRIGDTLWSIARRYGLALDQLRRLNGLGRSNTIRAGQRLRILP